MPKIFQSGLCDVFIRFLLGAKKRLFLVDGFVYDRVFVPEIVGDHEAFRNEQVFFYKRQEIVEYQNFLVVAARAVGFK